VATGLQSRPTAAPQHQYLGGAWTRVGWPRHRHGEREAIEVPAAASKHAAYQAGDVGLRTKEHVPSTGRG